MLDFPRWKVWSISLLLAMGFLLAIPSLLPGNIRAELPSWAQVKINLGLDLAGGSHLLLEADTSDVAHQRHRGDGGHDPPRDAPRPRPRSARSRPATASSPSSSATRPSSLRRRDIARRQAQPNTFGGTARMGHAGPGATASRCGRPRAASTRRSTRRWTSPATSSTGASTSSARSSRRSSARARAGSSSRSPASRIPRP